MGLIAGMPTKRSAGFILALMLISLTTWMAVRAVAHRDWIEPFAYFATVLMIGGFVVAIPRRRNEEFITRLWPWTLRKLKIESLEEKIKHGDFDG